MAKAKGKSVALEQTCVECQDADSNCPPNINPLSIQERHCKRTMGALAQSDSQKKTFDLVCATIRKMFSSVTQDAIIGHASATT